jgi:sec-independent protein translocase protein TatB
VPVAALESATVFLDPSKLLVILIVALVVLGPDKLPGVARQMGAAWGEIRKFRERLETEVRGTFPDLPSTHQVAQAVRSPLSFLDQLADAHEQKQKDEDASEPTSTSPTSIQPTAPGTPPEPQLDSIGALGSAASPREQVQVNGNGSGHEGGPYRRSPRPERTRPWRGSLPGEPVAIPDDPSMN